MGVFNDENGNPVLSVRLAHGGAAGDDVELAVSAQVAAAANNQTLRADGAGRVTYIAGFYVDGLGATGASVIEVSVSGLLGGTQFYEVAIPAGATVQLGAAGLKVEFARPIPASAPNTAIVVNVPSFGAGNTKASAGAHGFSRAA